MKPRLIAVYGVIVCIFAAGMFFGLKASPAKANEVQIEKLKRLDAQLDLVKTQFNQVVQPIITERNQVLEPLCKGIQLDNCYVDYKTGEVVNKTPIPAKNEKSK